MSTSTRCSTSRCPISCRCVCRTKVTTTPHCRVIEAGFPLLVEKPLVFDLEEADSLLAEAASRELFFAINFNHRYARPVQMAHDAIASGTLGPISFATWRFGGESGTSAHPHANLIETQCHGFDMLEHLCGPIESVSAHMHDPSGHAFSTMAVALTFESGAVGALVGSYDSSYAYPETHYLEVNGALGRVQVVDTVKRFTHSTAGDGRGRCGKPATSTTAIATSTTCSSRTSTTCWLHSVRATTRRSTPGPGAARCCSPMPASVPSTKVDG